MQAPKVFDQDQDDGMVIVLQEHPAPADQESARIAVRVCPASVITIEED